MRRKDRVEKASDVIGRIMGEFDDMPGLRLTHGQAMRFFGLDDERCKNVLAALVDAKFLKMEKGVYSRR